ncbi:DnaA N-terminal domain-containing protein [Zavarzinia aquatilis]|uniref:DnaA N-terminal domain-containing protein n=1 Tax=Zavarzinia aquatilis TaxID=2211142 RepID=UPI001402BBE3|nr:DnaA N-terminal domain-containing protein [Zavarzinia aquatilis]
MAELPTHLRGAFEAFWSAVPKRPADRPGKAREEFARLVKGGLDPQALVRAAERYAADVSARRVDPQFIPLVGKWLREGGHEAFPDPAPADEPAELTVDTSVTQDPVHTALVAAGMTEADHRSWIARCQLDVDRERSTLLVRAPTRFVADTVRDRFGPILLRAFGVQAVEYSSPRGGP